MTVSASRFISVVGGENRLLMENDMDVPELKALLNTFVAMTVLPEPVHDIEYLMF